MKLTDKIKGQFKDLLAEGDRIKSACGWDGRQFHSWPADNDYLRLLTQGLNLVKLACGPASEHYRQLRRLSEDQHTANHSMYLIHALGVVEAASKDFDNGMLFETDARIRAEVLDDFLGQAEALLQEQMHIPAASLGGAVLEDTLRKVCDRAGIQYPEKTNIEALNTELAKAGRYDKLVQKQITAYADLRNNADHGRFDKVPRQDVADFLKWLRRFIVEHLAN